MTSQRVYFRLQGRVRRDSISEHCSGLPAPCGSGAMQLGFRSVESGEKKIEALERIRSSLAVIDSQVQSEIPLTYYDEGERKYYFIGDRGFLQFATNYSIWGLGQGYSIATYTVETGEDGKQDLYATENTVGIEATRSVKLFDAFDSIYFEFFYKEPTEEAAHDADSATKLI